MALNKILVVDDDLDILEVLKFLLRKNGYEVILLSDAKKVIETIKKQEIAAGELDAKKMLLESKKQAIDRSFEEAKKQIESMDERKKEAIIKTVACGTIFYGAGVAKVTFQSAGAVLHGTFREGNIVAGVC